MSTEAPGAGRRAAGGRLATAVTVKGVHYPSITAAARAYGVDPLVVIHRRWAGWKMLKALTTPVQSAAHPVTVRGKTYRSVSAAAEALGVSYSMVVGRLGRGGEVERAFTEAVSPWSSSRARALTVAGKRYRSMGAAAEAFGLNPHAVRARIRKGWSLKRAFNTPVQNGSPSRAVRVNGTRYPSIRAAASAHGRALATVYARLRRGWTIERAISVPAVNTGRPTHTVHFQGRTYKNLDAAARALGLSPRLLRSRHFRELSDNEALTRASDRQSQLSKMFERREEFKAQVAEHESKERAIEFKGVRYEGYSSLARAYRVHVETVQSRLRHGWTLEQALGQAAPPQLVRHISAVHVAGEEFASIAAAARHFGVAWSLARYRLQSGASPEQAFGLVQFEARVARTGKPITVAGERFASITDACARWGKSGTLIQRRIAMGESPEQAFDMVPPPLEHAAVVISGRPFRFLSAAARHFQVKESKLRALINNGVEPQVAVGMILSGTRLKKPQAGREPPATKRPSVRVEGRTFRSVSAAARFFKTDPTRVHGLIARRGISPEEAIRIERARLCPQGSEGLSR